MRDEAVLRDEVVRDPLRFVRERLGTNLSGERIVVHADDAASMTILIPNRDHGEMLTDDMLDIVSGGGQTGANKPPNESGSRQYGSR